jgi:predicted metal-dependent phosphoesterase TrpH
MLAAIHVHTDYSACSESPVEEVARYCRDHGIGAIAITDHDLIDGALKLRDVAPDLKVIVGEEVSTRSGEIIGLFIKEKIEAGRDLRETCLEIKGQGGLVYLPHPFDTLKIHRVKGRDRKSVVWGIGLPTVDTRFSMESSVEDMVRPGDDSVCP